MATMTMTRKALNSSQTLDQATLEHYRYDSAIESMRAVEYPTLKGTTYLDHAGTTPYAKSLLDDFSHNMMSNLLGNPHSSSTSSQSSTNRVDDVRLKVLQFFNASPDSFDVVFVANATAGIKLIVDAFREHPEGFWYGYHKDAHTSLVGARQVAAAGHHCFESDSAVEAWLGGTSDVDINGEKEALRLFAYPAQSNMNGRRLPLSWCSRLGVLMAFKERKVYTLLDAAALVCTSPLDLHDAASAPDFTVLSFYKIFGFPDLGAIIIRKDAGPSLRYRRYFGGGTVDMVTCLKEQWHIKKASSLHEQLEDGTLPIHSIVALDSAFKAHRRLFKSMKHVSSHTSFLAKMLHDRLSGLRHGNGNKVCVIYKDALSLYNDSREQGPVIAFNLRSRDGEWFSSSEVEKLASVKNFQLRTGGLCNPGGIATALDLDPWDMKDNFSAGQRCGQGNEIMNGKPTGMVRVSLGAMSTIQDVSLFIAFIEEFFVESVEIPPPQLLEKSLQANEFNVDSLIIYPIKSCGGWSIPKTARWAIRPEGLAWDREWCLVHRGTREALSQKRYPKMALLRPSIDLTNGLLRVSYEGHLVSTTCSEITVPLSADPSVFDNGDLHSSSHSSSVCGEATAIKTYSSHVVATFFIDILGTPCTLARFPSTSSTLSTRRSKAHLQPHQLTYRNSSQKSGSTLAERPILLSNESPILMISRTSLDSLNTEIKARNPIAKAADASVFRANIVLAPTTSNTPIEPYCEDNWHSMHINSRRLGRAFGAQETRLEMLGSCRRCQMVCIDQMTAERNVEPFATLAKTRRMGGKVWFGVHGGLARESKEGSIAVGDAVLGIAGMDD